MICAKNLKVTDWFPKITTSKNALLAVSLYLDETINLHEVNSRAPFEGYIGADDNLFHKYSNFSKISKLHEIFDDANGYMSSNKNVRLVYVYTYN